VRCCLKHVPGIFAAITVTAITLVGYTAMAGVVGAGGLGDLAIRLATSASSLT
jgi:ABC-type methionine transport system permease subunit